MRGSIANHGLTLSMPPNAGIESTVLTDITMAMAYAVKTGARTLTRRNRCSAVAAGPSTAIWRDRRAMVTAIVSIMVTKMAPNASWPNELAVSGAAGTSSRYV